MVLDQTLNGENMWFWLAFVTGLVLAYFYPFGMKNISFNSSNLIFPEMKKLVHAQSNSDAIARWSSIIFFLYTLYITNRVNTPPR
jgi:hypothetical protein